MTNNKGFIATAEIDEETVCFFGEGSSPEQALSNFNVEEYCDATDIKDVESIEVGIFKAIYKGSKDWNHETMLDDWEWALGEDVKTVMVKVDGTILPEL